MNTETTSESLQGRDEPNKLAKNVFALVMRPSPRAQPVELTSLSRTIMNGMLKKGRDAKDKDRVKWGDQVRYRMSITELAEMFGHKRAKFSSTDCRRAVELLNAITVNFEPPSKKDQDRLKTDQEHWIDVEIFEGGKYVEKRVQLLLIERRPIHADIVKDNGDLWIYFGFDPFVQPLLLGQIKNMPFAQIDFLAYGLLKTQAAKALYEIVARTKDTESGSSGFKPWLWWVEALTFRPTTGPHRSKTLDEYRYFKQRVVTPAIAELNENSTACGFTVELKEKKAGRTITDLCFVVTKVNDVEYRQEAGSQDAPSKKDPMLEVALTKASQLDIGEVKLGLLLRKYGIAAVIAVLDNLAATLIARANDSSIDPIRSNYAWVSKVLERTEGAAQKMKSSTGSVIMNPQKPLIASLEVAKTYKEERYAQIKEELLNLPKEQQKLYVYQALGNLKKLGLALPSLAIKVESGSWTNPLLVTKMVDAYALEQYGPDWSTEEKTKTS